jgi:hypothetical protein
MTAPAGMIPSKKDQNTRPIRVKFNPGVVISSSIL